VGTRRVLMLHKLNFLNITLVVMLVALLACSIQGKTDKPIESRCPIEDLMIDKSLFQEEWYQEGPPEQKTALIRFGIKKLSAGFISQRHGVARHDVYEGENFEETERQYFEEVDSWFSPREGWTEWYIPRGLNYESSIADQYRVGCYTHKTSGVETCKMMAQYDVYLTRFHSDMSSIMTYYDLYRILQTIDNKMAECLAE
jgi:hypothetical protein